MRADDEGRRAAVELLRDGGVAVVPTDTVYGLAARPDEADAVRAIYRLKGRPEGMHLPVLAASVDQVRALGVAFTPGADALARRWWPGPLTLAFGFDGGTRPARLAGGPRRGGRAHPRPRLPPRAPGADRRARRHECQPPRRTHAAHGARRGDRIGRAG